MIDIAWSEFLFVGLLALILVGPKEMPIILKNVGRWVGRTRAMMRSFLDQFDLHEDLKDQSSSSFKARDGFQKNAQPEDKLHE